MKMTQHELGDGLGDPQGSGQQGAEVRAAVRTAELLAAAAVLGTTVRRLMGRPAPGTLALVAGFGAPRATVPVGVRGRMRGHDRPAGQVPPGRCRR
jgi:hypothetical protein